MNTKLTKLLSLSLIAGASVSAFATSPKRPAELYCGFTEPFLSYTFNKDTGVVTFTSPDFADDGKFKDVVVAKKGKLVAKEAVQVDEVGVKAIPYELKGDDDAVILTIKLDGQGSDGMSDQVYPYTAELLRDGRDALIGGCSSSRIAASQVKEE